MQSIPKAKCVGKRYLLVVFTLLLVGMALSLFLPNKALARLTYSGSADSESPIPSDNLYDSLIKTSYMTSVDNGFMRLFIRDEKVCIEYYDDSFNLTSKKSLNLELPWWGGFYKGDDGSYYLVEGKSNEDCVDGTEVLRIIKYDTNWKRIGAGKVLAQEGWEYEIRYPFNHGCVNMTEVDGKLYVITSREGYVDPQYGQGHQGMMLVRMDEKTFATEIVYGDFWHSLAQYIDHKGSDVYLYEQSEGGRCTALSLFDANSTGTDYFDAIKEYASVFRYGGSHDSAWAIPCYASVDDLALSDKNALGIGTSIDQAKYDDYEYCDYDLPYNIYLTVTPFSNLTEEATSVKWLTHYKEDKDITGVKLTKIDDNRFLVTWELCSEEVEASSAKDTLLGHTIHYQFVDGSGGKIGDERTAKAATSDCHPIVKGKNVVYYASDDTTLSFYKIDASSGAFSKKTYSTASSAAKVSGIKNKVYTGKAVKQNPVVKLDGKKLKNGTDYSVSYKNNKNVGTATVIITGKGNYKGKVTKKFKITKAANPLKVKPTSKKVKGSKLTKAKSFKIAASKGKGKVSYKLGKKAKKAKIEVTSKGKVTIPKNCKKGTYTITVKAAGSKNYKAGSKKVKLTIM